MLASCRPWSTNAARLKVLQHQATGLSKELYNIMCSLVNYQFLLILVSLSKLIYLRWKLWPKLFVRLKWLFREWGTSMKKKEHPELFYMEDLLQPTSNLHVYWSQSRKLRAQLTCLDVAQTIFLCNENAVSDHKEIPVSHSQVISACPHFTSENNIDD